MGKKRKAGGKPFGQSSEAGPQIRTKYGANETFDDSEDEFYAGRDKILLEERPEVKKRRKIEEDSKSPVSSLQVQGFSHLQTNSCNLPMKKFSAMSLQTRMRIPTKMTT